MLEQSRIDAVWQRVQGTLPMSFGAMARREEEIAKLSQRLFILGACRPAMKKICQQARARRKLLLGMSRLAGEQVVSDKLNAGELAGLVRLLGLGAMEYDPTHPVYGGVFAQFRQECVWGQKMLLEVQ